MTSSVTHIGLVGLGEVGSALAGDLVSTGNSVVVFEGRGPESVLRKCLPTGVILETSPRRFGLGVEMVLSAVPGRVAEKVADMLCSSLPRGTIFADFSTKSVITRDNIDRQLGFGGIRYVDVAIVDSVSGEHAPVGVLASGPGAGELESLLRATRFHVRILPNGRGRATEVKLCRSAFTKGLAALLMETLLVAERSGVGSLALETIAQSLSSPFNEILQSLVGDALHHRHRRADEMASVRDFVGLYLHNAPMTAATAETLERVGQVARREDGRESVDMVLAQLSRSGIFG